MLAVNDELTAGLHAVIEYLDEYPDTHLTLAPLAAVAHLSPHQFARQFTAATGVPALQQAQQLLRKSDLSLADIAASAGVSDQSEFSTHFKRVLGLMPRQFRTSARIA